MRWTSRIERCKAVNTGLKIAIRYNGPMEEVCEEAMMEPGCGSRALWCFARKLNTVSIARVESKYFVQLCIPFPDSISLEVVPPDSWKPSMIYSEAFSPKDPIGSYCRTKK